MGFTFSGVTLSGGITITTPPNAPVIGTATATGQDTATVSYTAPSYNGGATRIIWPGTTRQFPSTRTTNE